MSKSLKLIIEPWPKQRARRLEVSALAYHEPFRPKIVHRPRGTLDFLFMQFHSPVRVFADGVLLDYPPNTFFLWEPRATHRYGNPRRIWSHSWVHCDGPDIEAMIRGAKIPLNEPLVLPDTSLVDAFIPALYSELAENRAVDWVIVRDLMEIWIRRLGRCIPGSIPAAVPSRVVAARTFIEQNIALPLTLHEVASAAGVSPSMLSMEFRQHIGTSPMRYLLELRLKQASYLLADQETRISDIALSVGFRDPLYFSRQFKRHFGSSPRAYRRERS